MTHQPNRKAILISAFFTALILTVAAGGFALSGGWNVGDASAESDSSESPVLQSLPAPQAEPQQAQTEGVQPIAEVLPAPTDADVAAYQAQLEAAYAALNEAYTQIETLQSAQTQDTATSRSWDHDDDDDEHERSEHSFGEREHEHDDD